MTNVQVLERFLPIGELPERIVEAMLIGLIVEAESGLLNDIYDAEFRDGQEGAEPSAFEWPDELDTMDEGLKMDYVWARDKITHVTITQTTGYVTKIPVKFIYT